MGGVNAKCSSCKWIHTDVQFSGMFVYTSNRKAALLCEACSRPFKQADSSVQPDAGRDAKRRPTYTKTSSDAAPLFLSSLLFPFSRRLPSG